MELSMADHYVQFFRASGCGNTFLAYWDGNAIEIPFAGKDDGSNKPYETVELNGVKLRAIVDTGALNITVKRHAAEQIGMRMDAAGVRKIGQGSGVGDKTADQWIIDFKSFSIGDETIRNPQIIVSDDPPTGVGPVDIVLGDDFLRVHHILFAMSQDRLHMSFLGGQLFHATQKSAEAAAHVH